MGCYCLLIAPLDLVVHTLDGVDDHQKTVRPLPISGHRVHEIPHYSREDEVGAAVVSSLILMD